MNYKQLLLIAEGSANMMTVDSLSSIEPTDSETMPEHRAMNGSASAPSKQKQDDSRQFLHLLRLSSDRLKINRGRTEWRKKPTR